MPRRRYGIWRRDGSSRSAATRMTSPRRAARLARLGPCSAFVALPRRAAEGGAEWLAEVQRVGGGDVVRILVRDRVRDYGGERAVGREPSMRLDEAEAATRGLCPHGRVRRHRIPPPVARAAAHARVPRE